jgi:hypothetical protein
MWKKLKLNSQPAQYLKKNSTKIILEKNMWGNIVAKQKLCGETL